MAFHRDMQSAGAAQFDGAELGLGGVDHRQDLLGRAQKAHARGGQAQGLGLAQEQLDPGLFLKRLDLVRQRRLRQVQHLGRAGKPALIVDRAQAAKMAKFQMHLERAS